ncbi:MAG TPA: hypothetical protein DEV75_05325 [Desulfovibrio sp.]|nr:hypothetical protein [Desulfovibrio sp.]
MSEKWITRMVQGAVLSSRSQAREVARTIGKPYPTLMRELNPFDLGAKLGVETFFQILRTTRDVTPLEQIAQELGYRLAPVDGGDDERGRGAHASPYLEQ